VHLGVDLSTDYIAKRHLAEIFTGIAMSPGNNSAFVFFGTESTKRADLETTNVLVGNCSDEDCRREDEFFGI
jgi:hypothetical protein